MSSTQYVYVKESNYQLGILLQKKLNEQKTASTTHVITNLDDQLQSDLDCIVILIEPDQQLLEQISNIQFVQYIVQVGGNMNAQPPRVDIIRTNDDLKVRLYKTTVEHTGQLESSRQCVPIHSNKQIYTLFSSIFDLTATETQSVKLKGQKTLTVPVFKGSATEQQRSFMKQFLVYLDILFDFN